MKSIRLLMACAALVCFVAIGLSQGDAKHFTKEGLVFDYANGWTIADESNTDAQQFTLNRSGSDAQIRIFAHRGKVDSPEKFAQAKKAFIDPYVKSVSNTFVQMGAKPETTPATSEIGGAAADGVRVKASLSGEPGEADVYWVTLGGRVVVLTLFGPDKALKQATPAWDIIRTTLKIEPPPAKAGATPKTKP
jgi:hypothetical protein